MKTGEIVGMFVFLVALIIGLKLWAIYWIYCLITECVKANHGPTFWQVVWSIVLLGFIFAAPNRSQS